MGMRENAGEISLCGNVREKRVKCGSPPPNAGWLATMSLDLNCADGSLFQTRTGPVLVPLFKNSGPFLIPVRDLFLQGPEIATLHMIFFRMEFYL